MDATEDKCILPSKGERKLIDLGRRQIGEHMRRQATAQHEGGRLIIWNKERRELWPWKTKWEAVLKMSGSHEGAGGRRGRATMGGSVRRLRSGHLGLREDYEDEEGLTASSIVAGYWGTEGNERGEKQCAKILKELTRMATTV